jgi:5-methylcytosine-specific restriction endonuclease McrA
MVSVTEAAATMIALRKRRQAPLETHAERAKRFYASRAWAAKRYAIIRRDGGRCRYCGRTAADGVKIHVDHVEPISKRWDLRLEDSNLVVACDQCNWGKLAGPAAKIGEVAQ